MDKFILPRKAKLNEIDPHQRQVSWDSVKEEIVETKT